MSDTLTLASAIKRLRKASALSQKELAGRLGITAPYLSHLEAGRKEPSVQLLRRLAQALEIPPGVFLAIAIWADLPPDEKANYRSLLENLVEFARLTQLEMIIEGQ